MGEIRTRKSWIGRNSQTGELGKSHNQLTAGTSLRSVEKLEESHLEQIVNRFLQFSVAIAVGIARDQTMRRRAMFVLTLTALGMVFVGCVILWNVFVEHPIFFALYWLACGWITICVMLIAIYDLLQVIRAGREARREARKRILGKKD